MFFLMYLCSRKNKKTSGAVTNSSGRLYDEAGVKCSEQSSKHQTQMLVLAGPARTGIQWSHPKGDCAKIRGRDNLYPWTGVPIKSVIVGTHVCCSPRDRRRAALFLSCTGRLRPSSCLSGKPLVFHIRYAFQVLQYNLST